MPVNHGNNVPRGLRVPRYADSRKSPDWKHLTSESVSRHTPSTPSIRQCYDVRRVSGQPSIWSPWCRETSAPRTIWSHICYFISLGAEGLRTSLRRFQLRLPPHTHKFTSRSCSHRRNFIILKSVRLVWTKQYPVRLQINWNLVNTISFHLIP